jgi:hypothetical protein
VLLESRGDFLPWAESDGDPPAGLSVRLLGRRLDMEGDIHFVQLFEDAMVRLNPPQLDRSELLDDPLSVFLFENCQQPLPVPGLLRQHPIVLAGATDLEGFDGLETVVEGGCGPAAEKCFRLFAEVGGTLAEPRETRASTIRSWARRCRWRRTISGTDPSTEGFGFRRAKRDWTTGSREARKSGACGSERAIGSRRIMEAGLPEVPLSCSVLPGRAEQAAVVG